MRSLDIRPWLLALGLLALGCEEEEQTNVASGGPRAANAESGQSPSGGPPDYLQPPIHIPTPYRPPRQSTDTTDDEGGGGGGGRPTKRGERFGETFEDFSPNDLRALFDQARQNAQAADPADPCARLYAGFGTFMEQDDEGELMSERQFMRYCERMPPDTRVCFEAPEEQTEAEQRRCEQIIGTSDIFGDGPWERPEPPPGLRPTAAQRRQARQLANEAGRMQP